MTLSEFVRYFDRETQIVILNYSSVEYRGKVGEIGIEDLKNWEVVPRSVVESEREVCIMVNRI